MMETRTCSRCGSPIRASIANDGLCPACVIRSALEPELDEACSAPAVAPMPRSFGPYELIEEIGRGGMGVVFRARQPVLGRDVAVKLLIAGAYSSEADLHRFQREAEAAARLQHPNIIAIHDYGECDGQPYYAMDLIAGRNLAEACDGHPLPARRAAEMLHQLAEAVRYAHGRGVLHRDLKPSNVLVGADGRPRIGDFGLAKLIGSSSTATVTGQMLGSPSYASPEQAAGRLEAMGVASDVYGLGALLYHLSTGRAPFIAASPTETLRLVLETDPPPLRLLNPQLPRDLETICLTCLAKEPSRRYRDAGAVVDDLERFLGHRPIRARPPNPIYRMWKFCRRHRVGVSAVGAVFLVLVAALVAVSWALMQQQAALARSVAAERGQDEARGQAGRAANFMTGDFFMTMQRYANTPLLRELAEEAVRYYRQLPPESRTVESNRRHAAALEQLAALRAVVRDGSEAGVEMLREAIALRESVVRDQPDDPEAAALLLWAQWKMAYQSGDVAKVSDLGWRNDMIQRFRALRARFPTSPPVNGCLGWLLGRHGIFLAHQCGKPQEALAAAIEGRAIVEEAEKFDGLTLDDENHLVRITEGSMKSLAITYLAAGDAVKAVEIQEQCLARFTAALKADPGNLVLREMVADSALVLSWVVAGQSYRRMHEAELIAREHFRALMELDPENIGRRFSFAGAHARSPMWFEHEADYVGVRGALVAWDSALAPLLDLDVGEVYRAGYAELPGRIAEAAAQLGDVAEAVRWLEQVGPRIEAKAGALAGVDRRVEHARAAQHAAYVTVLVRDWPDRARMIEDARSEIEAWCAERPADAEMIGRRKIMAGLAGIASLQDGRLADAVPALRQAVADFPPASVNFPGLDYWVVRRAILAAFAEALAQSGEPAEARSVAEEMLAGQESGARSYPDFWPIHERLAAELVRVASLIDVAETGQAARRVELLDRAAGIIRTAESRGAWQTLADHDVKAKLAALQADATSR